MICVTFTEISIANVVGKNVTFGLCSPTVLRSRLWWYLCRVQWAGDIIYKIRIKLIDIENRYFLCYTINVTKDINI